uniref:Reverse transcriptase domain-containing protein n=1 Tax=Tanacetum cinerariifolium TaxID=118510 RepID=A0A699IZY4_TANCI|nr:reverse transcriptase domain-containing protein [Tanacetum cinerariifolium]
MIVVGPVQDHRNKPASQLTIRAGRLVPRDPPEHHQSPGWQSQPPGQEPTTPYSEPECFIHHTKKKNKRRNPFIPVEDQIPKVKYLPFKNLFEDLVVYNPFPDLPFPMADDQPMWGNNQTVAPTLGAAIVAVDLRDNFTVKDAWLRMKDLLHSFQGHSLGRGTIIQIFYHGLDEAIQAILDAEGIFLYKTPNEAHQLLKDRVLLKLNWYKDMKSTPICNTPKLGHSGILGPGRVTS